MDLLLNSVWALVALSSVAFWLRRKQRLFARPKDSFVALVMALLILFPVVSLNDDRCLAQNSSETDSIQIGDRSGSNADFVDSSAWSLPMHAFAAPMQQTERSFALHESPRAYYANPVLDPAWCRPPPLV